MKTKLKIGDRVRIKNFKELYYEYSDKLNEWGDFDIGPSFTKNMRKICDEIIVVEYLENTESFFGERKYIKIAEYCYDGINYGISSEMVVKLDEEEDMLTEHESVLLNFKGLNKPKTTGQMISDERESKAEFYSGLDVSNFDGMTTFALYLNSDWKFRLERASKTGEVYLNPVNYTKGKLKYLKHTNNSLLSKKQLKTFYKNNPSFDFCDFPITVAEDGNRFILAQGINWVILDGKSVLKGKELEWAEEHSLLIGSFEK